MNFHQLGEGYSGRNPVPTGRWSLSAYFGRSLPNSVAVSNYHKSQENEKDAMSNGHSTTSGKTETDLDHSLSIPAEIHEEKPPAEPANVSSGGGDPKDDKDRILVQSKKQTPLEKAKAAKRDDTIVNDPTTGGPVHLERSKPDNDPHYNQKLDPANFDHHGAALNPPDMPQPSSLHVNPNSAKPTNVLLQQFPAPVEYGLVAGIRSRLRQLELGVIIATALLWFLFSFGGGKLAFFMRSGAILGVNFGALIALHLVERQILRNISEVRMHMERQRGEQHSPPTPESVEWLNSILATVWPVR